MIFDPRLRKYRDKLLLPDTRRTVTGARLGNLLAGIEDSDAVNVLQMTNALSTVSSAALLKAGGTMTGALIAAAGTSGAPGLAIGGATNGFYIPGGGEIWTALAGTVVFKMAPSGSVTVPGSFINVLSFESQGIVKFAGTPQTLTGAGVVNLTKYTTLIVTTGANALTLAAGSEGQRKFIRMKTRVGDATLTVTNLQGGTTITFNTVGDFVELFFVDDTWHIIVNSGCAVA